MKDAYENAVAFALLKEALQGEEFSDVALLGDGQKSTPGVPCFGEQGLTLMAAGLAYAGTRVVLAAPSALLLGRAYEHIRSSIALASLPVCLVGTEAGFVSGHDGAARQMFEDFCLIRSLPNVSLLVPSDRSSSLALLREAVRQGKPAYLRLECERQGGEAGDGHLRLGGARVLRPGEDITLCSCGIMVGEVLKAADILARQEICAEVLDCYCLKPFPEKAVLSSLQRTGCCVTAEEHFLPGGLFETVAGLAAREYPVPVQPVAVRGGFGQSGLPQALREYYGLTAAQIVSAAVLAWTRRRR